MQLLHLDEAATSIYKYGIRNVPSTDPNQDVYLVHTRFVVIL